MTSAVKNDIRVAVLAAAAPFYASIGRVARRSDLAGSPVFIVGSGRCGSSLLADILKSHQELAVFPNEANDVWHPNSYPIEKAKIDTPFMAEDPAEFTRRSIESWPQDHDRYIRRVLRGFALLHGKGKRRIVVKSAMISFMVPKLHALFPDASFIHIYRFGPSVAESLVKKEWHRFQDRIPEEDSFRRLCASYWNGCIIAIQHAVRDLQLQERRQYYELSYEELCDAPQDALGRLAAFLGIDSEGYRFDLSQIESRNAKVGDISESVLWDSSVEMMREALLLKDYQVR
jgi:hypothetical protein